MKELENLVRELDEMSGLHATITVSRKDLEAVVLVAAELLAEKRNKKALVNKGFFFLCIKH